MSLRLSTGLLGELDCKSGDDKHIPKGFNNVIIGYGREGIKALVALGASPHRHCNAPAKLNRLGIPFPYRKFDARNLKWPEILKILNASPDRFYTQENLRPEEIDAIKKIFTERNLPVPAIGYYVWNDDPKGRFISYEV